MKLPNAKKPIKLLETVALLEDLPSRKLRAGEVGTVVEVLDGAYEVEFCDDEGQTYAEFALTGGSNPAVAHRWQIAQSGIGWRVTANACDNSLFGDLSHRQQARVDGQTGPARGGVVDIRLGVVLEFQEADHASLLVESILIGNGQDRLPTNQI